MILSIPSPDINAFHLGPLTIRIYALCLMTGMVVAWWTGSRRWKERGGLGDTFDNVVMWAIPLGIVGARIYHVLTHWEDYFAPGRDPISALYIWEGGIAIFGSLIGGTIGVLIATRLAGARLASVADALAPGMLLGQAIGRLGNWFNQELFGGPDAGPLGLEIDPEHRPAEYRDVATFQPTFLYELTWNALGAGLLLWLDRRFHLRRGRLFALYLVVYGLGRFWIEGIRTDFSYYVGPLRSNQVAALVAVLGGAALFAWLTWKYPDPEPWVERRGVGGPDAEPEHAPAAEASA